MVLLAACARSETAPPGPAPAVTTDGGAPDAEAQAEEQPQGPDYAVVVTNVDRYGFSTSFIAEAPSVRNTYERLTIVVSGEGSTEARIEGEESPYGGWGFASVPQRPYILETRGRGVHAPPTDPPTIAQYPINGAKEVRLGTNTWARATASPMAAATKLGLDLTLPVPLAAGDRFEWLGVRSFFYRDTTFPATPPSGQTNVPVAGASTTPGWRLDADFLGSPYGVVGGGLPQPGDDLAVHQVRTRNVQASADRFDPWYGLALTEVVGALDVASPSFDNGQVNTVTGTLASLAKETLAVTVDGASFSAIRGAAGYPKTVRATASVSVGQEPGDGPEIYNAVARPAWSFRTSDKPKVLLPGCFPEALIDVCSPGACAAGCDAASDGFVDPASGSYTVDAPRLSPLGRDLYGFTYRYSTTFIEPGGRTHVLSADAVARRPKTVTASFALELGPVRNLRVDDAVLPWTAANLSPAVQHAIRFDPPALGQPEYYEVVVLELEPTRSQRTAAQLYTRGTSVAIPDGTLRPDHLYYLQVIAHRDGRDFAEPFLTKTDTSVATGIFSPPFTTKAR